MLSNHNLKICWQLVKRDFRFHRVKNLILVMAAALVTGLYAFMFLLGTSVEGAYLLNYEYTYGSASHILFTGLTEHQADTLAGDADVGATVRLSTVGQLTDPMMGQRLVKLAVTDRDYAETVLSLPTTGRLPEEAGEIALDEFTMDSLGVLHELGTSVTLEWTDPEGQEQVTEFILCGWWASPTNFTEACAWITSDTARELVPDYDAETAHNVTLGVNLHQPADLEEQAAEILARQGVSGISYTTNLAYNDARQEQAQSNARPYYSPAVLVLLCGCLMIYGIINISAEKDRQFYGELKALGMTPRQLRHFLLDQGCAVSVLGLIPGWLLGFLIHLAVTGRIVSGMEENPALYFLTWQPFAAAGVCAVVTILLAYLLPTFRISGMLPAQVLRMSWEKRPAGTGSARGRMTLPRLAVRTLGRDRWRMAVSAAAMVLALLLLSSAWIQYVSLKEEIYMEGLSPWDYSITDGSAYLSVQQYNQENRGLTDETAEEMKARPEVTSVSVLKSREVALTASDGLVQRLTDYYNAPSGMDDLSRRETMEGQPAWLAGLERLEQTGSYTGVIVSIEGDYLEYLLSNGLVTSGAFDAEEFARGDYVLTSSAYDEGISTPAAGEQVTLEGKTFQVMASVADNGSFLSGANSQDAAFCIFYYVTPEAFEEMFPGQGIRQMAVNIDYSGQSDFEAYLDEFEQGLNRGVAVTRRSEYQANFQSGRLNTVLPELIVSLVLLAIALLNFMNMLVIKAVGRKREFAVYESLGMTRSQLKRLVLLEGLFHGLLMALIAVPLILAFDLLGMPSVIEGIGSWCMVYTFSALPLWITLPVMLALAAAVPLVCLRFVGRGSITERMRRPE